MKNRKLFVILFFVIIALEFLSFGSNNNLIWAYPMESEGYVEPCPEGYPWCTGSQPADCYTGSAGHCSGCSPSLDCCDRGSSWTRYTGKCKKASDFPPACSWAWSLEGDCNASDTCITGEKGLRPGDCQPTCPTLSWIYKTCCDVATGKATACGGGAHSGYCPVGTRTVWGSGSDSDCSGPDVPPDAIVWPAASRKAVLFFEDLDSDGIWDYNSGEKRITSTNSCLTSNTKYLPGVSLEVSNIDDISPDFTVDLSQTATAAPDSDWSRQYCNVMGGEYGEICGLTTVCSGTTCYNTYKSLDDVNKLSATCLDRQLCNKCNWQGTGCADDPYQGVLCNANFDYCLDTSSGYLKTGPIIILKREGGFHKLKVNLPVGWTTQDPDYLTAKSITFQGKSLYNCDSLVQIGIVKDTKAPEILNLTPTNVNINPGATQEYVTTYRSQSIELTNNLLINGSFEMGTGGWSNASNITLTSETGNGNYLFHSKSLRARTTSTTTNHWFQQDINIRGLSGFTVGSVLSPSFWVKGTSIGNQNGSIAIQLLNSSGTLLRQYSNTFSVQSSEGWKRQVFNYTADSNITNTATIRYVIVLTSANNYYYFDGMMLEKLASGQTSQGVFSDISYFQFSLEHDQQGPYTETAWPVRLMYAKSVWNSVNDGFRFGANPHLTAWTPGGVSFLSSGPALTNKRWYLSANIPVSYNGTLYFTVLGGSDNTYFTLTNESSTSGIIIEAHWKIRFESTFPLRGTENSTLFASNFKNQQDTIALPAPTIDTLFMSTDYGVTWHRMGTTAFAGLGTIEGNVYTDLECDTTTFPTADENGWLINCFGFNKNDDRTNYTCGPYTEGDSVQITFSADNGLNRSACSLSNQTFTIVEGVNNAAPFYQSASANAWWQAQGGNVYGETNITSDVPTSAQTSIFVDNLNNPAGVLSCGTANGIFWGNGTAPNFWAQSDANDYQGDTYNYSWWEEFLNINEASLTQISTLDTITQDGIYTLSSRNLSGNLPIGKKIVIFYDPTKHNDEDLLINNNTIVPVGSFLLVIVKGNMEISFSSGVIPDISSVQGIYVVDGNITLSSHPDPDINDISLNFQGSLISWGDSIINYRDLGQGPNATMPAASFTYRPDFVINAPDYLKKSTIDWKEITP